jgi:SAM-dependent methyltransferase
MERDGGAPQHTQNSTIQLPQGIGSDLLVKPKAFARKSVNRARSTLRWQQRVNARRATDRVNDWDVARFDRKLGVDTGGRLVPTDATVRVGDASLGVIYIGTQPRMARWWLTGLPRNRAEFTFIDMGSGKGRVLLFALEAGFRRAVGVEFAEELHAVAANNARIAGERGLPIEPVLGDAGAFEFPDEPLVVHFNNPFHDPVMMRVIGNLTRSYEQRRRPIVVVYHQLTVEDPGDETGNLALLDEVPFLKGRTLEPPTGFIDRNMLARFTVRVYESAEVLHQS